MIEEAYVSFETAKLLKEKGFDLECFGYYVDDEPEDVKYSSLCETNSIWEARCCSAPTQQMAMRWLRKAHNLFIEIKYATSLFSQPHTTIYFQICYMSLDYNTSGKNMLSDNYIREYYTSYEQAVEAAINYCLENLI